MVALGWPLWQRRAVVRRNWLRLLVASLAGAVAASGSALAIGWAIGLPLEVLLSLVPKSVTAPVAMGVAEAIGCVGDADERRPQVLLHVDGQGAQPRGRHVCFH